MTPTLRAAIWMTGAIASFSAMAIAGRAVSHDLDTFELMLYRSCVGFVIVLTVLSVRGRQGDIRTTKACIWCATLRISLGKTCGSSH